MCFNYTPSPSFLLCNWIFFYLQKANFIHKRHWMAEFSPSLQSPEVSHCFPRLHLHFVLKGFQLRWANMFLMEINAYLKEVHYNDNKKIVSFCTWSDPRNPSQGLRKILFSQQLFTWHTYLQSIWNYRFGYHNMFFILRVGSSISHKDKLVSICCHCATNTLSWVSDALTLNLREKKILFLLSLLIVQNLAAISVPLPAHLLKLCPSNNNKRLKAQKYSHFSPYRLHYLIHCRC